MCNCEVIEAMPIDVALDEGAYMPERAHPWDAGLDLRTPRTIEIPAGGFELIDTGVHMAIPEGWVGILKSKSGLSVNRNIHTIDGVIDSGYTGSIVVKLHNAWSVSQYIEAGDKISQLVLLRTNPFALEHVTELDETERGANGFGSTGR